jgi:hypothetical protein
MQVKVSQGGRTLACAWHPAAVVLGLKGWLMDGPARAKKLGEKNPREAARKAAAARWSQKAKA